MDRRRIVIGLLEILSSSSSSDEDIPELLLQERQNRAKIQNFIEVVHQFSDEEFQQNFRLQRETVVIIVERYAASPHYPSDMPHGGTLPFSAEHDILSFSWFSGNKVSYRDVAQRFGVSISTTFQQLLRVMDSLISIAPMVIKFPGDTQETATDFYNIAQFPDTLGCIDGTSITIRTPAHKIKSTYVNRHDIPSITLQAICDTKKKFINVSVGTPGKIHARVFELSEISSDLSRICGKRYHIIGDAAYPIREWLLVPFRDYGHLTEKQKLYNKRFCSTRVLIENSFTLLKVRFRQLLEIHMHEVGKICKFIVSCCVLHNLCIEHNDAFHFDLVMEEDDEDLEYYNDCQTEGHLKRLGGIKRNNVMNRLDEYE